MLPRVLMNVIPPPRVLKDVLSVRPMPVGGPGRLLNESAQAIAGCRVNAIVGLECLQRCRKRGDLAPSFRQGSGS
jgi:hypothetical protein